LLCDFLDNLKDPKLLAGFFSSVTPSIESITRSKARARLPPCVGPSAANALELRPEPTHRLGTDLIAQNTSLSLSLSLFLSLLKIPDFENKLYILQLLVGGW
jgi:hypothetical protein